MEASRRDFGDFDPFGDFELLYPAAVLGLGIVDIPIPYMARTYGETNIQRFRHGLLLLKMTWIGLIRIKPGSRENPDTAGNYIGDSRFHILLQAPNQPHWLPTLPI